MDLKTKGIYFILLDQVADLDRKVTHCKSKIDALRQELDNVGIIKINIMQVIDTI